MSFTPIFFDFDEVLGIYTQFSMQKYTKMLKLENEMWNYFLFLWKIVLFLLKNTCALAYMKNYS